jgi:phage-related protein (TIGR01555 family)
MSKRNTTTTKNAGGPKPTRSRSARSKPSEASPPDLALHNNLPLGTPFSPFSGFPQNQGSPYSEQISQVTTVFKNLRWYLVSNFRQPLSEAYVELGLVQAIVDIPVDDALRGGVEIKSQQMSEEEIEKLQVSLDRDDDLQTIAQAAKWNRLFGGSGVIVLTDQDPEEPLDLNAITAESPLSLRAADLWELTWTLQNADVYDPSVQVETPEFYDYYGVKVHKSRVMAMKGLTAPSFIRPRLRGWGFSVVEILIRSINQYLKATDLTFEVLDEFKVDVYKMKNLINTLMSPTGKQAVNQRIQQANYLKNYQHAIVMDSEDDFDHKNLSFAGLAEVMTGIRMQVASDMRMPLTKLFGISSAGFNSGEDDLEVYNSMVESQVRSKIKYDILRVCELKCQKLFGYIPDDLSVQFKPLRVLSAEQEENVKTQKFNRVFQARQAGLISGEQFVDACNRDELLGITLDKEDLVDLAAEGANDPGDPKDAQNPGEGRKDEKTANLKDLDADQEAKDAPQPREGKAKEVPEQKKAKPPEDVKNSIDYDKAAYEADGGDKQFDERRSPFFENPGNVDEALWMKAKEASMKAFGKVKYAFVTWWYKKEGGKFH